MHSKTVVRSRSGELLGVFPSPISDHAAQIRDLVARHPGSSTESVVTLDAPCPDHPAYESDNCPLCGTARLGS